MNAGIDDSVANRDVGIGNPSRADGGVNRLSESARTAFKTDLPLDQPFIGRS